MKKSERGGPRRPAAEVRAELVAATIRELDEVGVERASLRGIARRAGMTHQAVAYHFADRNALLTEVAIGGFGELAQAQRQAVERSQAGDDSSAGTAIATIGKAYVQFARDNKSRFELMFRSGLLRAEDPRLQAAQGDAWSVLRDHVCAAVDDGWSGGGDPDQLAYGAWAIVHGLATLEGNFAAPRIAADPIIDLFTATAAAAGRTPASRRR